jgi:hypothetical protein
MSKKIKIPEATEDQINESRERILKDFGKPVPGLVLVRCLICRDVCSCNTAVPSHIPFPDKHNRFVKNLFNLVGK